MSFSIFSSTKTWESGNSKRLHRTDAEDEEQAKQVASELLKRGHEINTILNNDSIKQAKKGRTR